MVCVRAEPSFRAERPQTTSTALIHFSRPSASNRLIRAICRTTPRCPSPIRRPRMRSTRVSSASSDTKVHTRWFFLRRYCGRPPSAGDRCAANVDTAHAPPRRARHDSLGPGDQRAASRCGGRRVGAAVTNLCLRPVRGRCHVAAARPDQRRASRGLHRDQRLPALAEEDPCRPSTCAQPRR